MRLVPSTRCPLIDAELAIHANVVLYANEQQLVLLKYSRPFGVWYVCGFQGVCLVDADVIPEPHYYWRNIGYVETPSYNYALLQEAPQDSELEWAELYNSLVDKIISQHIRRQRI